MSVPTRDQRIEELGRIIMAYSEVTEKLQQSHDQLNATVRHLQAELGESRKLLERKNRLAALGEMAAGLAHEIRNPLGGIQLYASMLQEDLTDRPDAQRTAGKITTGVKRLEKLVGQVLNFSRDVRAQPMRGDLVELVQEAVELTTAKATAGAVTVTTDLPGEHWCRFDASLMQQAVLNVVLNAIEASDPGGRVTVTLTGGAPPDPSGDCALTRLCVRDTGAGIPVDLLDRIFNPFFTTKDAGTGLGLSIVHRIVEAHGGTITARNATMTGKLPGGAVFEIEWGPREKLASA